MRCNRKNFIHVLHDNILILCFSVFFYFFAKTKSFVWGHRRSNRREVVARIFLMHTSNSGYTTHHETELYYHPGGFHNPFLRVSLSSWLCLIDSLLNLTNTATLGCSRDTELIWRNTTVKIRGFIYLFIFMFIYSWPFAEYLFPWVGSKWFSLQSQNQYPCNDYH